MTDHHSITKTTIHPNPLLLKGRRKPKQSAHFSAVDEVEGVVGGFGLRPSAVKGKTKTKTVPTSVPLMKLRVLLVGLV